MAIGHAEVRGTNVYVFDEKGKQLYFKSMTRNGSLVGFTSTTVSIKIGPNTNLYDEKGRLIKTIFGK